MAKLFPHRLALCALLFALQSAAGYCEQPVDNQVRTAEFVRCEDGDTVMLNIFLGDRIWVRNRKIRLKDVHCYEISTAMGITEKKVLEDLMAKGPVCVMLTTAQSYDRIVGIVWAGGVNVNAEMLKQPQGGR